LLELGERASFQRRACGRLDRLNRSRRVLGLKAEEVMNGELATAGD
jgi:hypothetical protein